MKAVTIETDGDSRQLIRSYLDLELVVVEVISPITWNQDIHHVVPQRIIWVFSKYDVTNSVADPGGPGNHAPPPAL